MEQKIIIRNKDYDIHALLNIPTSTHIKLPVVILLHGTASDKHEVNGSYDLLAQALANADIASIRFDFIGTGESEVDYIHYTFSSALSDIECVIQALKTNAKIDSNRIGMLGWSQGGSIALLSAARFKELKSMVTWAASIHLANSLVNETIKQEFEIVGYHLMEFAWREPLKLSKEWFDEANTTDIIQEFKKASLPILSIHGKQDEIVPFSELNLIAKATQNQRSKQVGLETADHIFHAFSPMNELVECIKETVDWFIQTL